jgi:tRNA-dihydrouridine synthase 3
MANLTAHRCRARRFLLEWLSFLHRYIPVGLLEVRPQKMSWRPPPFTGRSDLETLLGSGNAADWVRISEMLLGPAPAGFVFSPKHKSNSYAASEVGMAHEAAEENG